MTLVFGKLFLLLYNTVAEAVKFRFQPFIFGGDGFELGLEPFVFFRQKSEVVLVGQQTAIRGIF